MAHNTELIHMATNRLPVYPDGHNYYGPFVEEALTDGWCYGTITEFLRPDLVGGCDSGDGFVVAPNGDYCGLVWWVECPWEFEQIAGPRGDKFWGIFEVRFLKRILTVRDLVENFRHILPALKASHDQWRANGPGEASKSNDSSCPVT